MSKELSAEWEEKIRRKANDYLEHRFDGQFSITTPGIMDDSPVTHFAAGYSACVIELIEAQERIKDLEETLLNLMKLEEAKWTTQPDVKSRVWDICNKVLSPVNPKKKEDEKAS